MRKLLINLYLATILVIFAFSWQFNNPYRQEINNPTQEIYQFDQIIDHYNYYSTDNNNTWKQRYFVFSQYYKPAIGPVILYICGQAQCRGISNTSWTAQIAKQTHGIVLSLQHRYYGKSLPFNEQSFTKQNLKFLSSEQALNDLAYFITKVTEKKLYNINPHNKWITIGGSYPGALSAWFRSKFPHLTVGAIASSAVVLAVQNFQQFDEQIYLSAVKSGSFCVQAIQKVTKYVEDQVLSDNRLNFQAQFNAQKLTSRQFLFYWSDMIVFYIQYGSRQKFCNSVRNKTLQEVFNIVKQTALKYPASDYGAYYLKNPIFAYFDGRGARSWIYQSCTQFSYFQTFSQSHPMRSKMLTIDFYRTWCQDIFGAGTWPYTKRVNVQFGGLNFEADNIIMTNGGEDPWKWASLQKSHKKIISKVINCDNCAHCVDLHTPAATDSLLLRYVRQKQLKLVQKWISQ